MADIHHVDPGKQIDIALTSLQNVYEIISNDPSLNDLSQRIHKCSQYLALISKDFPRDDYLQKEEAASPISNYVPTTIPIDDLLQPISPEKPSGENIQLTGEFNSLLDFMVNRSRDPEFKPKYFEASEKAMELLQTKSKDLGVVIRLIEAMTAIKGFTGLADGFVFLNKFLERFWETLYPQIDDEDDYEIRSEALHNFQDLVYRRLTDLYGVAHEYDPHYNTREEVEKDILVFSVIIDQFNTLNKFTYEKLRDQAPSLDELKKMVTVFNNRIKEKQNSFLDQEKKERQQQIGTFESDIQQQLHTAKEDEIRQEQQRQEQQRLDAMPKILCEPQSIEDVIDRLKRCALYLIKNAPNDPLGYSINRAYHWFGTSYKNFRNYPSTDQKKRIAELWEQKEWKQLLEAGESCFAEGGHCWFDLQYYTVGAAQNLGKEYDDVTQVLRSYALLFLRMSTHDYLTSKLPDLTPVATEEAIQWINGVKKEYSSDISANTVSDDDHIHAALQKAYRIAKMENSAKALAYLVEQESGARSGREKFLWRLHIVEFCISCNLPKVAIPSIEELVQTIDQLQLRNWENTELLCRVFKAGHEGYLKLNGSPNAANDKVEYYYNRICLHNPGYFINAE